jgi:hypothetical protein
MGWVDGGDARGRGRAHALGSRLSVEAAERKAVEAAERKRSGELVTNRCLRIAHGVPFLRERLEGTLGLELTPRFEATDVAERELCREAFGSGWRLPERAELIELAEQGVLPYGDWFYSSQA